MVSMNLEELRTFLVEANKHTYATGDESLNKKEIDQSTTIYYEQKDWSFHDNFFGGEPYGGREVIFYKNKPIWMMVYYGSINETVVAETVYSTLQKALRAMPESSPFRGPHKLEDGEFTYMNTWAGTIENFSGEETILKNGKKIYTAKYIGGLVDKKR